MKEFNKKIQAKFAEMSKTGKLFRVALTGQEIWGLYLNSFSKENNPVFRAPDSTSKNCNHCNNFIRRYANIVALDENNNIVTMFDVDADSEYQDTVKVLSAAIKDSKIVDVFFETFNELNSLPYESCKKTNDVFQLGVAENPKRYNQEEAEKYKRGEDFIVLPDEIKIFNHFHLFLDKAFVDASGDSVEKIMGNYREAKEVFQKGMEIIPLDTLNLVKDLINQGSLLDGATHLHKIEKLIPLKTEYDNLPASQRDNWCWVKSFKLPIAKFKNELMGELCSDLAEGVELNKACQSWNKRVDSVNYMKATAPITKKQIEEAKKFVEENGYAESFDRRFATIDDIDVSEIRHTNVGDGKIKKASIFDNVKSTTSTRHKRSEFDGVEEVSIDKFMEDILPTCTSVEAFFTNNQQGNLVSLTTANNPDAKPLFKWNNPFSWTFNGNLAGKSEIKAAVKSRGGNVDGVMRVSLSFPATTDDYDLHLVEPTRNEIYFSNLRSVHLSSGVLDLDAEGRDGHQEPEKRVENIVYTDKSKMPKGAYKVFVNNYTGRGLHTPCFLEIEVEGEVTILKMKINIANKIEAATINFDGSSFDVAVGNTMEVIDSKSISKEIYGLETNQFHKVNLVCESPNHWGDNNVGNKHYFFMLEGCKSPVAIRSFHNENLLPELAQHRKVLEVLGATNMIAPADKQLSGLGFNATVRDEAILRLSGTHKRTIKVKFK